MILDGLIASTVSEGRMKAKFLNILTDKGNQVPNADMVPVPKSAC